MNILANVGLNGPPIEQPSICLYNLESNKKIESEQAISSNLVKIFLHSAGELFDYSLSVAI